MKEKSKNGSWNYWAKDSPEASNLPYPDDLDDTFLALGALHNFSTNEINGKILQSITAMLPQSETKSGGPYKTWLINSPSQVKNKKDWSDIDIAVNANIAYFLALQGITLDNLDQFILQSISRATCSSPYYGTMPILYFISRYHHQLIKISHTNESFLEIKKYLNTILYDTPIKNTLELSLSVSILIYLNVPLTRVNIEIRKLFKRISHRQNEYAKLFSFNENRLALGLKQYHGAGALTAALFLQAISLYEKKVHLGYKKLPKQECEKARNIILKKIKNDVNKIPEPFKTDTLFLLQTILEKDTDYQITLLPYFLQKSMALSVVSRKNCKKVRKIVTKNTITKLGIGSLYGWTSYSTYDKIFDGDQNGIQYLMSANWYLREMTLLYRGIIKTDKTFNHFKSLLVKMEAANCREKELCSQVTIDQLKGCAEIKNIPNFGDYSILADKSFGHALASATLFYLHGYGFNSKETWGLLQFFKHYLIARQLHDDGHDWEEDLKKGMINSVCVLILEEFNQAKLEMNATVSGSEFIIEFQKDLPNLQNIFWNKSIIDLAHLILKNCHKAYRELETLSGILDLHYLKSLVVPLEKSAHKILAEHKKVEEFLTN